MGCHICYLYHESSFRTLMKHLLLIILLLASSAAVFAVDSLFVKAEKLRDLYSKVSTAKSGESRQAFELAFFLEFPDNFRELVALYGFENDEPAKLYNESYKHIHQLYNGLTSINDTIYLSKTIRIAINGKWDADGISSFQHGLTQRIIQNKELTVFLLNKRTAEEAKSFWYFIFDGPHPDKKFRSNSRLQEFELVDKATYSIMMDAYKQALADNELHGH